MSRTWKIEFKDTVPQFQSSEAFRKRYKHDSNPQYTTLYNRPIVLFRKKVRRFLSVAETAELLNIFLIVLSGRFRLESTQNSFLVSLIRNLTNLISVKNLVSFTKKLLDKIFQKFKNLSQDQLCDL